jgi:hypothetical protein
MLGQDRLKQLDGIAGRVIDQDLLAAHPDDDVADMRELADWRAGAAVL